MTFRQHPHGVLGGHGGALGGGGAGALFGQHQVKLPTHVVDQFHQRVDAVLHALAAGLVQPAEPAKLVLQIVHLAVGIRARLGDLVAQVVLGRRDLALQFDDLLFEFRAPDVAAAFGPGPQVLPRGVPLVEEHQQRARAHQQPTKRGVVLRVGQTRRRLGQQGKRGDHGRAAGSSSRPS